MVNARGVPTRSRFQILANLKFSLHTRNNKDQVRILGQATAGIIDSTRHDARHKAGHLEGYPPVVARIIMENRSNARATAGLTV
jgi:hypothetical protein